MAKLTEFTVSPDRPLPVILLADVSGSMASQGKIDVLNRAVREMITEFGQAGGAVDIQVAIITIGGEEALLHQPLRSASEVAWRRMEAGGKTPMGAAFQLAREMIEDPRQIPSRSYAPTLILLSDGIPTDTWKEPLEELLESDRASKAQRFAMAIGGGADREMLQAFLGKAGGTIFEGHEAREITKFLRWVTMSVTVRSRSTNPNEIEYTEPDDWDLDY